jgi:hydrogenase nickel incorporation protein HypA/HybF
MHELALAEGVMAIVAAAAAKHAVARVRSVSLELGALAHVEPVALIASFAAVSRGTVAAEARLQIERTPGAAWCMPCGERVALERLGDACPNCGSHQLQVVQGEEMRVREIAIG